MVTGLRCGEVGGGEGLCEECRVCRCDDGGEVRVVCRWEKVTGCERRRVDEGAVLVVVRDARWRRERASAIVGGVDAIIALRSLSVCAAMWSSVCTGQTKLEVNGMGEVQNMVGCVFTM